MTPDQQPRQQMTQQDFMGLLAMMQQGQQANINTAMQPRSRISNAQNVQRGTPGLDQWHRNNPNASNAASGTQYGQIGEDVYAGPNPAFQQQQQPKGPGIMETVGNALKGMFGGGGQPQQPQPQAAAPPMQQPQPMGPPAPQGPMAAQPVAQSAPVMQPPVPQAPPAELNSVDGFNQPIQPPDGGGEGMGLQGLFNSGFAAAGPGMAAGKVAGSIGNVAQHAGNQLPQLMQAYQGALGNVSTGQNAMRAGAITAGELAPAMRGAQTAYGALQAGTDTAASTAKIAGRAGSVANVMQGGSKLAGGARALGKIAAPVQAGMMGIEAGRLAFDPEFREQAYNNHQALGDKSAMAGLGQGLSAPISTIANSAEGLWGLVNSSTRAGESERKGRIQAKRPGAKKGLANLKEKNDAWKKANSKTK